MHFLDSLGVFDEDEANTTKRDYSREKKIIKDVIWFVNANSKAGITSFYALVAVSEATEVMDDKITDVGVKLQPKP